MKSHLLKQEIKVLEVKEVSHESARFKSFRVTLEKREDFNKVISGRYLPEYVKVKRFFTPRSERSDDHCQSYFRAWEDPSSREAAKDKVYISGLNDLTSALNAASGTTSEEASAMDTATTGDGGDGLQVMRTVAHLDKEFPTLGADTAQHTSSRNSPPNA